MKVDNKKLVQLLTKDKRYKGTHRIYIGVDIDPDDVNLKLQIDLSYQRAILLLINSKYQPKPKVSFERVVGPYRLDYDIYNKKNKSIFREFLGCLIPMDKLKFVKIYKFSDFLQ